MTETAQSILVVAPAGLDISDAALTQAVTGGHTFANNGKQYLIVQNGDSGSTIATIVTQGVADADSALAVADRAVTVLAGKRKIIGPFKPSLYNDASGLVHFTLSDFATGVLVGVIQATADAG
jgi:hypothetical protein